MSIFRLNHAVLYVRNVAESVAFYRDLLGFDYIEGGDAHRGAAFLRAPGSTNDHDLGLFELGAHAEDSGAGKTSVGLYHLAWEVDTLGDLDRLMRPPRSGRRAHRLVRPRHHEVVVRQGSQRDRVRGRLDHPARAANRRRP